MFRAAARPVCQCAFASGRATYFTRRTKLVVPDPVEGTYEDILQLQDKIDDCVYERDELREITLPLQVEDNRLRARFKEENWKLREFDEWIARQDPNWQPPPRLPHGRKKRNKRLREIARDEARARNAALKAANLAETVSAATATESTDSGAAESAPASTKNTTTTQGEPSISSRVSHSKREYNLRF
ncbi:hypothetical protein P389DRAFT_181582 [Cystobasidium minutum MCA 4210]|uniref:uncharacterized protein n=1 Tax=Cystobasidium minutum MCA 4210 TaxID=1397322 RepID=UPI0034CF4F6A|eukprot:jgi/Rhomi1/181582/fgenesh1_pg.7_\